MDNIDLKIIQLLKENARISYSEIGRIVHMTSPADKNRIEALEDKVIEKYTISINNNQFPHKSFILFKTTSCEQLTRYLSESDLVLEFYRISGEYNYIAKVQYASNTDLDTISRETTNYAFSIAMPILS